jgi:hypothetical protein
MKNNQPQLVSPDRTPEDHSGTPRHIPVLVDELSAGKLCPVCEQANLDYDGLLNLVCPACGYTAGGCFT